MKYLESERIYLIEGIISLIIFVISIPLAMSHFIRGSIAFSMMMPFMVLNALIATFTLSVHFDGIGGRYKNSAILNPKGMALIIGINLIPLVLINI